jgi:hypothetical protein
VGILSNGIGPGTLTVIANVNEPGAWVLSNQTITAAGRAFTGPVPQACNTSSFQDCQVALGKLHLRQLVTYQPASRFWALQWRETAIFLVLAAALAGFLLLAGPAPPAVLTGRHREIVRSAHLGAGIAGQLSEALFSAAALVDRVPQRSLARATPCQGWGVLDVINHLAAVTEKFGRFAAPASFCAGQPESGRSDRRIYSSAGAEAAPGGGDETSACSSAS